MGRTLTFLLFSLFLLKAVSSYSAEHTPVAMFVISQRETNDDDGERTSEAGDSFGIGHLIGLKMTDYFWFDTGLLYINREVNYGLGVDYSMKTLQIPLGIMFRLWNFQLGVGTYFGYAIGRLKENRKGKEYGEEGDPGYYRTRDEVQKFDYEEKNLGRTETGLTVSFGFTAFNHLHFRLRLSIGGNMHNDESKQFSHDDMIFMGGWTF